MAGIQIQAQQLEELNEELASESKRCVLHLGSTALTLTDLTLITNSRMINIVGEHVQPSHTET